MEELAGLGAEIVTLPDLGHSLREYGDLVGRIISAEIYPRIRELADNRSLPLDEAVRPRVMRGRRHFASAISRRFLRNGSGGKRPSSRGWKGLTRS